MADNYEQATVEPCLDLALISATDLEILEQAGFSYQQDGYFYAESGLQDFDSQDNPLDWPAAFLRIAKKAKLKEIVVEGSYTCSKMRQGEFGGFVVRITPRGIQFGGTQGCLAKMRKGEW